MCWMAAIPIAIAAGSSMLGAASSNKAIAAQNDALRKQAIEQVKQMNYTDANLKMELADTKDSYVSQKTDNNMQMVRNLGTLRAAIGESGLEGNSMKRIMQVTQGDYMRQEQGLNDDYTRDYSKIFGNRVSNIENSKSTISNILSQEKKQKSTGRVLLDAAMAGGQAYAGSALGSSGSGQAAPISKAVGTKTA